MGRHGDDPLHDSPEKRKPLHGKRKKADRKPDTGYEGKRRSGEEKWGHQLEKQGGCAVPTLIGVGGTLSVVFAALNWLV